MAIVQEVRCDFCGTVLFGRTGITKVARPYIEIAGFVRDWSVDPDTSWRESTFISAPDKRQMAFCTLTKGKPATCFQEYVDMKRDSWRVRQERSMREETSATIRGGETRGRY